MCSYNRFNKLPRSCDHVSFKCRCEINKGHSLAVIMSHLKLEWRTKVVLNKKREVIK